jgi:hypothetical protein
VVVLTILFDPDVVVVVAVVVVEVWPAVVAEVVLGVTFEAVVVVCVWTVVDALVTLLAVDVLDPTEEVIALELDVVVIGGELVVVVTIIT